MKKKKKGLGQKKKNLKNHFKTCFRFGFFGARESFHSSERMKVFRCSVSLNKVGRLGWRLLGRLDQRWRCFC